MKDRDDSEGTYDHHNDESNRDVHVYTPTPLDSDVLYPLASRKEELVELFTLHRQEYGGECRLRGAYDEIKNWGENIVVEGIGSVNEELMNRCGSGDEGYSETWTLLLERGDRF